jgi:hypothetical protein
MDALSGPVDAVLGNYYPQVTGTDFGTIASGPLEGVCVRTR